MAARLTDDRATGDAACSVEGCGKPIQAKGVCGAHYRRLLLYGDPLLMAADVRSKPEVRICIVEGCDRKVRCIGLCEAHYRRKQLYGDPTFVPPAKYGPMCGVEGCERPPKYLGMCPMHYQRVRNDGDPGGPEATRYPSGKAPEKCGVEGCEVAGRTKRGLCERHYARWKRTGDVGPVGLTFTRGGATGECIVDGCTKNALSLGLCSMHGRRLRVQGEVGPAESFRPNFAGRDPSSTRSINDHGYVTIKVPGHPEAKKNRWALEHRVVMSDLLGRPLLPHENVHHINGVRHDNRIENLELWTKSQPWGQRVRDKVAWARQILELYVDYDADVSGSGG